MKRTRKTGRVMGDLLIAAGLIILLGVGIVWGRGQLASSRLATELAGSAVVLADEPAPPAMAEATAAPLAALPPAERERQKSDLASSAAVASPATTSAVAIRQPAVQEAAVRPTTAPMLAATQATPTRKPPAPKSAASPTRKAPAAPGTVAAPYNAAAPARIVIPDLKMDIKVVPMGWQVVPTKSGPRSDWVIPKNAAGHHINSAVPGQVGNVVLSGHNNIFGQVFKPISLAWSNNKRTKIDNYTDRSDLLNGRTIQLYDGNGRRFDYEVVDFYRLKDTGVPQAQRIKNAAVMGPTDEAQLTIITCWPPSSNTHRLVLIAEPAG
jgi:sortase A